MAEGKRLYEGRARDGGGGALKANGGGDGSRKGRIIREFVFWYLQEEEVEEAEEGGEMNAREWMQWHEGEKM